MVIATQSSGHNENTPSRGPALPARRGLKAQVPASTGKRAGASMYGPAFRLGASTVNVVNLLRFRRAPGHASSSRVRTLLQSNPLRIDAIESVCNSRA